MDILFNSLSKPIIRLNDNENIVAEHSNMRRSYIFDSKRKNDDINLKLKAYEKVSKECVKGSSIDQRLIKLMDDNIKSCLKQ